MLRKWLSKTRQKTRLKGKGLVNYLGGSLVGGGRGGQDDGQASETPVWDYRANIDVTEIEKEWKESQVEGSDNRKSGG